MAHVEGNTRIKAPVEEVFRFVADWHNVASFYEGIYEYVCTGETACGDGARFCCTVKSPLAFVGDVTYTMEMSDFKPNNGWTLRSIEGPEMTEHWWFDGELGWPRYTRVTYDLHYRVPVPVVGPILDVLFVKREWESRILHTLRNIRILTEAKVAA